MRCVTETLHPHPPAHTLMYYTECMELRDQVRGVMGGWSQTSHQTDGETIVL